MSLPQPSNVLDVRARIPGEIPSILRPEGSDDISSGRLLDVIPLPGTGQCLMIVAHLVPEGRRTPARFRLGPAPGGRGPSSISTGCRSTTARAGCGWTAARCR
jgi:hypothetical protein